MISLGLNDSDKLERIERFCADGSIRKVVVFSPAKFRPAWQLPVDFEHVEWTEIIQYKFYYRLLQEIGPDTLLVINECLRTQNRYDLTYNCLRLFLQQTPHALVFQYLPAIDTFDDFMVLFDFDTRSRWKREAFRRDLVKECSVEVATPTLAITQISVETDANTKEAYAREKRKLIDKIGLKDPHTIPRNLHLMSGRAKLHKVYPDGRYVGRNNRFGLPNMATYRDGAFPGQHTTFEFCHNFIDFSDFLSLSRQHLVEMLVSDLRVDQWYFDRYTQWFGRIHEACSILRG